MLKCPEIETVRERAVQHLRRPLSADELLRRVATDIGLGWDKRGQQGWLQARRVLADRLFGVVAELVKAGTAKVVERPNPPRSAFVLV